MKTTFVSDLTVRRSTRLSPKARPISPVTVSDQYGTASCFYTINVVDATPPTLNCPQNVSVLALLGQTSAQRLGPQPTATDNCPMVTLLTSHQPGVHLPLRRHDRHLPGNGHERQHQNLLLDRNGGLH